MWLCAFICGPLSFKVPKCILMTEIVTLINTNLKYTKFNGLTQYTSRLKIHIFFKFKLLIYYKYVHTTYISFRQSLINLKHPFKVWLGL